MKTKRFLIVFTFLVASNLSFASFPANNNYVKQEVLVENFEITSDSNSEPNSVADKARIFQILSISFSAVSITFSLLSIATGGYGFLTLGILFLIPAIIFAILYYAFK